MSGPIVFLPALLFLTLPFTGYLDATHHWYSVLAGTAALLVVIEKRTKARLAWSGLLWGTATCFTQSAVVAAMGTAIFLIWEHYRVTQRLHLFLFLQKQIYFIGSLVATVLAFNAYFHCCPANALGEAGK